MSHFAKCGESLAREVHRIQRFLLFQWTMGSTQVQPLLSTEKAAIDLTFDLNEKQHLREVIRQIKLYSPKHQSYTITCLHGLVY